MVVHYITYKIHLIIPLMLNGYHIYHCCFNNQNLYILPTECIYGFCIILTLNSNETSISKQL
jgi:hypothetical protein